MNIDENIKTKGRVKSRKVIAIKPFERMSVGVDSSAVLNQEETEKRENTASANK